MSIERLVTNDRETVRLEVTSKTGRMRRAAIAMEDKSTIIGFPARCQTVTVPFIWIAFDAPGTSMTGSLPVQPVFS